MWSMDQGSWMENDRQILDLIRGRKVIVLLNKTDLEPVLTEEALREACGQEVIPVSAKEQQGIDRLEREKNSDDVLAGET